MQGAQTFTQAKRRRTLRGTIRRMRPLAGQTMKKAMYQLPMTGAFFLLSLADCFFVPSPYAVCCLAALISVNGKTGGAMLGICLGTFARYAWGIDPDLAQLLACCLCRGMLPVFYHKRTPILFFTAILLILRALPGILEAETAQTAWLSGMGVLLGMVSMPALLKTAQFREERKNELRTDDVLCLALPFLLMLSGAAKLTFAKVNLGIMAAQTITLAAGWMLGCIPGICAGLSCGLALMMGGQGALPLVLLTIGAPAGGLLQGKNRLLAGLPFLVFQCTAMFLTAYKIYPLLLAAAVLGMLLFSLIPTKYIRRINRFAKKIRWGKPKENAYLRLRMQQWVQAIDQMADALPKPRSVSVGGEESEIITERLCQDCDRLPICWRDHFEKTKAAMEALSQRPDNEEDTYRLINSYFDFCPRISRIPGILYQLDTTRQERSKRVLCADYERAMLQTHLTALSQAAQQISLEGTADAYDEQEWVNQTEEALQALRFPGHVSFVKKVDGRMTACLAYEGMAVHLPENDTLARHIGIRLGVRMQVTEQRAGHILLEAEPLLYITTGMATACAVTPERKALGSRRPDNGDAVLVRHLSGGRVLVALSDGMGHGAEAREESKKTLELLSLCMETGYTRSQAMTAVNGSMLSATGGEQFATVDLCMIDLWTGHAAINKLGACASVLVQGQKIRIIEGEALPLGIIEHVVPMEHTFQMGENDLLLLMSDGVTDAFSTEEQILSVIRRGYDDTPQHIADALLQEALIQQDGLPADDMTVLCVRVQQRYPERKRREEIT